MGKYLTILTLIILAVAVLFLGKDMWLHGGAPTNTKEDRATSLAEKNRVSVTHAFQDGVHRYTGTFLLPHSCFIVQQTGAWAAEHINISFDVEDRILTEKTCAKITTRYPFTVIVEAPEAAIPVFYLNDEEVPSKIRELEWQSAVGNFIDTSVTAPVFQ